jgi:hypothetical protein
MEKKKERRKKLIYEKKKYKTTTKKGQPSCKLSRHERLRKSVSLWVLYRAFVLF